MNLRTWSHHNLRPAKFCLTWNPYAQSSAKVFEFTFSRCSPKGENFSFGTFEKGNKTFKRRVEFSAGFNLLLLCLGLNIAIECRDQAAVGMICL